MLLANWHVLALLNRAGLGHQPATGLVGQTQEVLEMPPLAWAVSSLQKWAEEFSEPAGAQDESVSAGLQETGRPRNASRGSHNDSVPGHLHLRIIMAPCTLVGNLGRLHLGLNTASAARRHKIDLEGLARRSSLLGVPR